LSWGILETRTEYSDHEILVVLGRVDTESFESLGDV
jgi:hypothetical protein